jgi:branched-chain amino acid transport system substrate-binding protein
MSAPLFRREYIRAYLFNYWGKTVTIAYQKSFPYRLLSGAAIALLLVACSKPFDNEIKIGHVAPLTGSIAHLGKQNENGALLAVEEINKAGLTINGKKLILKLVPEDDAADPKTAIQVAQKLVDAKVIAVVGHLNSGTSISASKIYSAAGITQVSPSATNPNYTKQGFKTTYRLVATDAEQGPALASYVANNLKAKVVAIIDDSTQYGKGLADEFEKTVKAAGITVLTRESSSDKATDFKAILTKVKVGKPDVIMYGGTDTPGGLLAKQALELGIPAKIVGGDFMCSDNLAEFAGDAIKNVICSEAAMALSRMKAGPEFQKKYKERFNIDVDIYAPFAYDAVYLIVDAMKRANSVEPTKILAVMPQTNFEGLIGNIAFEDNGDLRDGIITIYDFKDKKKSVLEIIKM